MAPKKTSNANPETHFEHLNNRLDEISDKLSTRDMELMNALTQQTRTFKDDLKKTETHLSLEIQEVKTSQTHLVQEVQSVKANVSQLQEGMQKTHQQLAEFKKSQDDMADLLKRIVISEDPPMPETVTPEKQTQEESTSNLLTQTKKWGKLAEDVDQGKIKTVWWRDVKEQLKEDT